MNSYVWQLKQDYPRLKVALYTGRKVNDLNDLAGAMISVSFEIYVINLQVLKDLCWVLFSGLYLEAGWSDYQNISCFKNQ